MAMHCPGADGTAFQIRQPGVGWIQPPYHAIKNWSHYGQSAEIAQKTAVAHGPVTLRSRIALEEKAQLFIMGKMQCPSPACFDSCCRHYARTQI